MIRGKGLRGQPLPAVVSLLAMGLSALALGADNTTYGTNAGAALFGSADGNTLIGASAGENITYGDYNTFVGDQAGQANTYSTDNVFLGYQAGLVNLGGYDNTFAGYKAGVANSPDNGFGNDNSFFGPLSGVANTTGYDNTFFGYKSGYGNTTGSDNLFFGYFAGYGSAAADDNTAVGYSAMRSGTHTGYGNAALGYNAGEDLAGGVYNTFIGHGIDDNGDGNFNTFVGFESGSNNEYADYNTFIGAYAGWENNRYNNTDDANRNTYFGASAGASNWNGEDNLVIGSGADLDVYAEGHRVVVVGADARAGYSYTVNEIVLVGSNASSVSDGAIVLGANGNGDHKEAVVIGFNAESRANKTLQLGNASTLSWDASADASVSLGSSGYRFSDLASAAITTIAAEGSAATWALSADAAEDSGDSWQLAAADGGTFSIASDITGAQESRLSLTGGGDMSLAGELYLNSDARLKTHIQPVDNALAATARVQAVHYRFNHEKDSDTPHLGLIAQQLEPLLPALVHTGEDGRKTVNYIALVPLLVESVKELADNNRAGRERLEQLKARKAGLEQLLASTLSDASQQGGPRQ